MDGGGTVVVVLATTGLVIIGVEAEKTSCFFVVSFQIGFEVVVVGDGVVDVPIAL